MWISIIAVMLKYLWYYLDVFEVRYIPYGIPTTVFWTPKIHVTIADRIIIPVKMEAKL